MHRRCVPCSGPAGLPAGRGCRRFFQECHPPQSRFWWHRPEPPGMPPATASGRLRSEQGLSGVRCSARPGCRAGCEAPHRSAGLWPPWAGGRSERRTGRPRPGRPEQPGCGHSRRSKTPRAAAAGWRHRRRPTLSGSGAYRRRALPGRLCSVRSAPGRHQHRWFPGLPEPKWFGWSAASGAQRPARAGNRRLPQRAAKM